MLTRENIVLCILDLIESPREWEMWLMSWSYPKRMRGLRITDPIKKFQSIFWIGKFVSGGKKKLL